MRIIDKNTDYYDYLQNSEDTLVFDRRGSYLLTKEKFCNALEPNYYLNQYNVKSEKLYYKYVLLQCGATFWLIVVHVLNYNNYNRPANYELQLIATWKDYDKPRALLKLDEVSFNYYTISRPKKGETYHDAIEFSIQRMINAIKANDIHKLHSMNGDVKYTDYKGTWKKELSTIPILTACGISEIIDPIDIFTAIEEHFSLCKTESERIDPIGATNDDKITMHGFDTKTSFRGKASGQ